MKIEEIIPENISQLRPYVAGKTIAEVMEAYKPPRISKLASNENRLGYSPLVKNAITDAMEYIQDYPDPVSQKLRKKLALLNGVNEEEILITAGSESLISVICRTLFKQGEYAITADATFVGFFVQAGVRGVHVEKIPVTKTFKFDIDGILKAIKADAKLVYIANPNNPTGTYLTKSEYKYLIDNLPDDVLLIADEAYFEYAKDIDDYPSALDYRKKNVILLRTFSKAFGLAGLRVGYGIADAELITQMSKTRLTFEPTTLAQAAAFVALDDTEFIKKSVQRVTEGRERLYTFFDENDIEYVKSISNSVLMVCNDAESAAKISQAMLEQGVILRRTQAFGLPHCIRITIGTEEEMEHFERSFLTITEEIYS
ncbi:MAG: histidinol-phosphate transaminase [Balneolaceae bacterium]|nr:histidinol-phosphate transaminase [Balneolaceae bacterium]